MDASTWALDCNVNGIADYPGFAACMGGPNNLPIAMDDCAAMCLAAFDSDADSDIDLHDFAAFIYAFESP